MNRFAGDLAIEVRKQLSRNRTGLHEQPELQSYLHSRGYLTYEAQTEVADSMIDFDAAHYRTDTLQLILLPTEECNFRCNYCYESFSRGAMEPALIASLKLLMEQRIPKLKSFHISWFGGEPLLEFDIVSELTSHARQICLQFGTTFSSNMTTNGSLLFADRANRLIEQRITEYQITLDGPELEHDRSRPGREGSPTFSAIVKNLLSMHQTDLAFEVILRINVDCSNNEAIPSLLRLLASLIGDDSRFRLLFRRVGEWGGENDSELQVLDERSAAVDFGAHKRLASSLGLIVGGGLLKACTAGDGVCYAARPFSFVIGSDGRIMKCTVKLDGMPENVVGQLGAGGQMTINDARMRQWIQPSYRMDEGCQSCQLLPNCQGMHCPAIRIRDNTSCCPEHKSSVRHMLLETAL